MKYALKLAMSDVAFEVEEAAVQCSRKAAWFRQQAPPLVPEKLAPLFD
jgi:hypothetical protein